MTQPDAALVTAYLQGDRNALGALYDRFAPSLYDTAAAMLRDRHEAADVVQETFLVAAERMGQLRDPERIKPWLFAIARNEIYRRTKRRGRVTPSEVVPEMAAPIDPAAEGAGVEYDELAALVREAALGLDERDQLVLELSVRQGLQGADLAAALGVTPEQSYTLVHRMRDRVERTLGAVIVARKGRKDCPELQQVLTGWDGTFSVLWRKRVARHVEGCETCERTRRAYAPLALFGAAPVFALPTGLRDVVLSRAEAGGGAPSAQRYRFDADGGFPATARGATRLFALVAASVALVLLVVGGLLLLTGGDDDDADAPITTVEPQPATTAAVPPTAPAAPPSTIVAPAPPPASSTAPATTAPATTVPSTTAAPTTTAPPSTPPPPPGDLTVSRGSIDLGRDATQASLVLANVGGQPVQWSRSGGGVFDVSGPAGGTLAPGAQVQLTVSVDRGDLDEGEHDAELTFAGDDSAAVSLSATVERAPSVRITAVDGTALTCQTSTISVQAAVTDESAITSVTGRWSGPAGSGTFSLTRTGTRWKGAIVAIGGFGQANGGTYTVRVSATDSRGNTGSDGDSFEVQICPQ